MQRQAFGRNPDLIIFNGDLAFGEITASPLVQQYAQANEWLAKIYNAIGSNTEMSPILFVPGNHDLNRKQISEDQTDWLERLEDEDRLYRLIRTKDLQFARYLERQDEWANFVANYPSRFQLNRQFNGISGHIDCGGIRVGIAALNTSWSSHTQHEKGKLWMSRYQWEWANDQLQDSGFRIIATHHPPSWLQPSEAETVKQKLQSLFHLSLHGHEHSQWFESLPGHLSVFAGSCFDTATKQNAYSWIEIDFASRSARVRLRRYSDEGSTGWIPLQVPGKTGADGESAVDELFAGCGEDIPRPTGETSIPPTSDASVLAAHPVRIEEKRHTDEPQGLYSLLNLNGYIQILETHFDFLWEPGGYDGSSPQEVSLYWPVKLRKPTLIHAAQAYAASGLQLFGANVSLYIDDLGTKEGDVAAFSKSIQKWFEKTAGVPNLLKIRTFSEIVTQERYRFAWEALQKWFTNPQYQLKEVFAIAKLSPTTLDSEGLESLLLRKPRRLLTPAMVWTCLLHLAEEMPGTQLVTLGGNDERGLWNAWRDSAATNLKVGHLYVPELLRSSPSDGQRAVHMDQPGTNLNWYSKQDIRDALRDAQRSEDWTAPGRLIPWAFVQGVQLPRYLNEEAVTLPIGGTPVRTPADLSRVDSGLAAGALSDQIARYIF